MAETWQELLQSDEDAYSLFCRGRSGPLSTEIPCKLLSHLRGGEIFEVVGKSSSGKTELLLHVTIQCILPTSLGGNGDHVVYFDNDFHLHFPRLIQLVSQRIQRTLQRKKKKSFNFEEEKKKLLKAALERLHIYRCSNMFEFLITLQKVHRWISQGDRSKDINDNDNDNDNNSTIQQKEEVRLLIIDSVSSFYWQNKFEDQQHGLSANKRLIELLWKLVNSHNLVCFCSKIPLFGLTHAPTSNTNNNSTTLTSPSAAQFQDSRDIMGNQWKKFVQTVIVLKQQPMPTVIVNNNNDNKYYQPTTINASVISHYGFDQNIEFKFQFNIHNTGISFTNTK